MVHPGSPGMMLPHLAFQSVAEKKKKWEVVLILSGSDFQNCKKTSHFAFVCM